ncbi:19320_t:CDS:2 [Funneliformis geosporum]|uniref:5505_t:CDS:1 n=1 Tax=Funneliformis geosporum TaxID=1117311 RepID=A0A9W4SJT1_9GLOM|nr:19320_t:CDS:2 [Funneliformis geosporum]CAI2171675.1 5505_t:CDS:2 [Funneliformis geosporum]
MNNSPNIEKRHRIKELLKRKQPTAHSIVNEKVNNKIITTTNLSNVSTEKITEQLPIAKFMTTTNTKTTVATTELCVCVVCGRDLSCSPLHTREKHFNACLDDKIEIETNSTSYKKSGEKRQENKKQQNSLFAIAIVCPCCNRTFKAKTEKGKLEHFKKCGKKYKHTPSKMLEFLQELKIKYGRDHPYTMNSIGLTSTRSVSSLHTRSEPPKEKKLTNYFNSISKDKSEPAKIDRTYNFSSIVFKARSTVESSNKCKREIDDDDDFQVGVALSRSMLPPERKSRRKKVKYDLNTTPILPCAEAINKAKERAVSMFFNRPTINEFTKNLSFKPEFSKSKVGEKYIHRNYKEIEGYSKRKRHSFTWWEIQAFGGDDNPLSREDYITDMIWHYHT